MDSARLIGDAKVSLPQSISATSGISSVEKHGTYDDSRADRVLLFIEDETDCASSLANAKKCLVYLDSLNCLEQNTRTLVRHSHPSSVYRHRSIS